jgi:hypothetical protein
LRDLFFNALSGRSAHPGCRVQYRLLNLDVTATATEIASKIALDFLRDGLGLFIQNHSVVKIKPGVQ